MNKTFSEKLTDILNNRDKYGYQAINTHKDIMDAVRELVPDTYYGLSWDGRSNGWNSCREEILKRMGE